jgi:hypothetical protein
MMLKLISALAISLGLTLVLESAFFFIVGMRNRKDFLLLLLVNIITNPVVVLTYSLFVQYTNLAPVIVLIPLELFAIIAEGCYYKKYGLSFKRPYFFSIGANAFSYCIGLLLQLFTII